MSLSLTHGKSLDIGQVGIAPEDLPPLGSGPIELSTWFADRKPDTKYPIDLEIGCGKGTFLVQQAQHEPDINYLGLEYARKYWRYAADRCRRRGLNHVRIVCTEAATFLHQYVREATFRQVHIYYPDPWPKRRHHKRRLIQPAFLRQLHHILEPASRDEPTTGRILIATDHLEYFLWMQEQVADVKPLFNSQAFERPHSASPDERVGTNYERKYKAEGRSVYGMTLVRQEM